MASESTPGIAGTTPRRRVTELLLVQRVAALDIHVVRPEPPAGIVGPDHRPDPAVVAPHATVDDRGAERAHEAAAAMLRADADGLPDGRPGHRSAIRGENAVVLVVRQLADVDPTEARSLNSERTIMRIDEKEPREVALRIARGDTGARAEP